MLTLTHSDAIEFGEREELIAEGRKRVLASPARYVKHIYGEKEAGGASMLYLSPVPFPDLGLPALSEEPLDRYAEAAMLAVPPAIVGVSVLMAGTYWIIKRREQLMHQTVEPAAKSAQPDEKEAT